ncbi:MAG TPA: hypothetical protein VJH22_07035 [Candidatus Nanoarchaeia archaeon]|nr:hypothetical protein [Candidatus Nanoarchaeia archaeon]
MDPALLKEYESKFAEMKKRWGFQSSLDDIESIFFVKDMIAGDKFVSEHLSRSICYRMSNLFVNWNRYLNSLMVPNPGDMILTEEHQMIDEQDKQRAMILMSKSAELASRNSVIGLTKDAKEEGAYIDACVNHWRSELLPFLTHVMKKVNKGWHQRATSPEIVDKPGYV